MEMVLVEIADFLEVRRGQAK